jgi:hypothetical protein
MTKLRDMLEAILASGSGDLRRPEVGKGNESSVKGLHIIGDLAGAPVIKLAIWIVWGVALTFVVLPGFVLFQGKRYCSWICGCGGLAETFGDRWRHLARMIHECLLRPVLNVNYRDPTCCLIEECYQRPHHETHREDAGLRLVLGGSRGGIPLCSRRPGGCLPWEARLRGFLASCSGVSLGRLL